MKVAEVQQLAVAEESFWWHRGRQRIVKRVLNRYVPKGSRILDVGCGPGGTTLAYSGSHSVLAVDASMESARHARERGIAVATMDATHLAVRDATWDAVVSLDLIEHIPDDVAALREMHRAIRPGGMLVVTVPAYQFLWSSHDEAVGHVRRYTRAPLVRRARAAGFEVVLATYVMSSILPAAMLFRLAERLRPPRANPEANFTKLPGVLNTLLEHAIGFGPTPLRFLPIPFGLSIVLVGRRPEEPARGE